MLKQAHRLTKTKDIESVNKAGKSFFTKVFIMKFLPNKLKSTRITVVVSTKISKNAVVRNRVKRVMRDKIRTNFKSIKPGFDIIFYASKFCLDEKGKIRDNDMLLNSISFALDKSGLLIK
jgi:ribonuclease P protein component